MKTFFYKILLGILIAVYVSSMVLSEAVLATPNPDHNQSSPFTKNGPKHGYNPETGKLSFIGDGDPIQVPGVSDVKGMSVKDRAWGIVNAYSKEFKLKTPSQELKLLKSEKDTNGKDVTHFQQMYKGIPVIAGEMVVNANENGKLLSIGGEVSSDLTVNTKSAIKSQEAGKIALGEIAKQYELNDQVLTVSEPELWIFDESLLTKSTRPVELVWRMEVTPKDSMQPIREMVLINAQTGKISFHINQVDTEGTQLVTSQVRLESQQAALLTTVSTVHYADLAIDEVRGKLYGADKAGNKVDVIDMADLSIVGSYSLVSGALPSSVDLSPDGNELAVAQSGSGKVAFINLPDGTVSQMSSALSGSNTKATDVIYGRAGVLYTLSTNGLHVVDLTVSPHVEKTAHYVSGYSFDERLGAISSDKNTLYYVTGTCCSGANELYKFDVSAALSKPARLAFTYLYQSWYKKNIRLSLADDNTLLTAWGSIYDTTTLTLKAKNGQKLLPVIALPGRSFYAIAYDDPSNADSIYFFDEQSSYQLTSLSTNISGTPRAMAVTSDGNTLFVSSTGGMSRFEIGVTPPGTAVNLPASLHQYRDFVFDMNRGVIYGTDASNKIDVIDQNTGAVVNSYLLPNGADPIGIDISPDGGEAAVALNGLEAILFFDPETGHEIVRVKPPNNDEVNLPYDVIYSHSGRLYSNGNPGSVGIDMIHAIDTTTHTWLAHSYEAMREDSEMAITADDRYLYANEIGSPNNINVFDLQADTLTRLYEGPHGPVLANKFDITPDGSKVFTSDGQVWSRDMGEQIGTLEGAPGNLIQYVPGKAVVALTVGNTIEFISANDYHLISTYFSVSPGTIREMEVASDGSRLIANFSGGEILILDTDTLLSDPPQIPIPSTIKYDDLVTDSARGRLYGADKAGNKIDVISMSDLAVVNSYALEAGARPTGLDLSLDGNELAVAQSGLNRVAFINLTSNTISQTAALTSTYYVYDVLYGRPNLLYALSNNGIHTINTSSRTEDLSQYVNNSLNQMFGVLSSDKNTLYFIGGGTLYKFDVSAGLPKPTQLGYAYLYNTGNQNDIRLSLADDNTILTSWGSIFDVSTMTLKARNGQSLMPVLALPGRNFYAVTSDAVASDGVSSPDTLCFFDAETSYKRSSLGTGRIGTPGAMAVTSNGNTLFVSSTGGMSKFEIGTTPPGTAIPLPQSLHHYLDFAFDMPRSVIYGTDESNRIDVIDQKTGNVLKSFLLPNSAKPIGIDLSPDGSELAIALSGLENIIFINSETGATIAQVIPQPALLSPYDVIYGRTGRLYAVGSGGQSSDYLHVIDTSTHTWLNRSAYPNTPSGSELAITSDKKYLYAGQGSSGYVFDVQNDALTTIYKGYEANLSDKFAINPDGSRLFASHGEVWSGDLKEQRGSLEGGAGTLVNYVPGQGAVVVVGRDVNGNVLRFVNATNYRLLTTYRPTNSGTILEIEIAPDGSKLIVSFSSGDILILDISNILPGPPVPPPTPALSMIQYDDLVVDEVRGQLYGADKANSKIDVINMSNMYVVSSYSLVYGAYPAGLDLSPDGNELAIAQSGLNRLAFVNLTDGTVSEMPSPLRGYTNTDFGNPYDIVYGRAGILYSFSNGGLNTINTTTHIEDISQFIGRLSNDKLGAISSDRNTLFFTADSALYKFNVLAGLTKPTQIIATYIDDRTLKLNIRLSLTDDSILLTSWGNVYDTSFIVKAKNGQKSLPVIGLPGRNFYAIPSSTGNAVYFWDEQTSHKLSSVNTGKTGAPGAMVVTGNGNTLFLSSTGGMTKLEMGMTPPGTVINPPTSLKQYRDFAFDMARGVIYGTDASGRVDVIDQSTSIITKSYLLPNGADPIGIDLSPNGTELAVALHGLQCILFLNPETGTTIARVKPLNNDDSNLPYDVIYGRSGRLYSDASPDFEYIHVFDTTTHTWIAKSSLIISTGAEMAMTSDHKYLYTNEKLSPNNILVFDVQTDTVTKLYEGPHGYVTANRFTIAPNGSKVFTSSGQVWSGNMQTRLGTLFVSPGTFIKFIPNKNMVALTRGNAIEFVDATNYRSIWIHYPGYAGDILELEVSPDGSKLIANYPSGTIYILDLADFPPTPLPTSTPGPGPSPTPRPITPGPSPTSVPSSFTGDRQTYTALGGSGLPGTFLCDQSQPVCTNGVNDDADKAHQYAADTFVFYNIHHGRNSIDNQGGTIISTVHYGVGYQNAFWNGYQMVYGDYMVADDIVGHELTHGVTQYTSNLIYAYQSGAINESFSDIWGEFVDQTNGSGNDTESVKWLLGEDSFLRANRSMKNPPAYGAPDKMSSLLYSNEPYDNGGVHINSGVNNKAAYLMVEGDAFNGRTIIGIGLNKTAAIYYEVQVHLLTAGANYNDLYFALNQACQNLIGGADGITPNDCIQVQLATEAVEMIPTPLPTMTPTLTSTFTPTLTSTSTFMPTTPPAFTATSTLTNSPMSTFADVPLEYWAENFIHSLYNAGITGGCNVAPLKFCPEATVTRAQMAVFLLRGIHGSSYSPPDVAGNTSFSDVPTSYWAAAWIKELAAEGITGGCASGKYCPETPVTRDQMAVFLLRSKYTSSYSPPDAVGSTGFGDVPANHWAADWIKQLVTEGITAGCGNGNYCPGTVVTRSQMAVFLVRTFDLP
jgi:Zn-dependent metalloprotease/streptogramin lyase